MTEQKCVSIVCPVNNEEEALPLFYERLKAALAPLQDKYDFELLFTNNRSVDRTLDLIRSLCEHDPMVHVLTLSRNFGYQASVLAGLTHARGDCVVVIDVDCEDPPEMIPRFIAEWENGYDIVYGRRDRRPEFIGIQWMRKLFYRILRFTGDSDIILDMAEFALVAARVRDTMIDNVTTFPFLRAEIGYAGFDRKAIPYTREARITGKTHYNFLTMAAFAVGGILSSSTYLLRMAAFVGAVLLPINLSLVVLDFLSESSKAFRLLVSLDLMYLVFFVAVLSIYMARIYKNGVRRPVFIVDWEQSIYQNRQDEHVQGIGQVREGISR
jgi:dolichol-phosphate mannosyltransferase